MNRILCLLLLSVTFLSADEKLKSPVSPNSAEGKSVYLPLTPSVNLSEEARIQQYDQNISRGLRK